MTFRVPRAAPALALVALLFTLSAVVTTGVARGADGLDGPWSWPLSPRPEVVQVFEPPVGPYAAGHRGVDLSGSVGQPVLAIGAGTVTFAGVLAGRGVLVVSHGELRSTYEPVTAALHVGDEVAAGVMIGLLQSVQSHCVPEVCLHLGVRRGRTYLDPLSLFGPREVRLKPWWGHDGSATPYVGSESPGPSASASGPPPTHSPWAATGSASAAASRWGWTPSAPSRRALSPPRRPAPNTAAARHVEGAARTRVTDAGATRGRVDETSAVIPTASSVVGGFAVVGSAAALISLARRRYARG